MSTSGDMMDIESVSRSDLSRSTQATPSSGKGSLSGRQVKRKHSTGRRHVPTTDAETPTRPIKAKKRKEPRPLPAPLASGSIAAQETEMSRGVAKSPSPGPGALKEFEFRLDATLAAPDTSAIPRDVVLQLLTDGEQQLQRLCQKGAYPQAKQLAIKLLRIDSGNTPIKLLLLTSLERLASRHDYISYATKFVRDTTIDLDTRVSIGATAFTYCFKIFDFDNAVAFGNELLQIADSNPGVFDTDKVKQYITTAQTSLLEYNQVNDTHTPGSPLQGISKDQFELLTLWQNQPHTCTEEQSRKLNEVLSFCIGNEEFSRALRTASQVPGRVQALQISLLPSHVIFGERGAQSTDEAGKTLSSVRRSSQELSELCKELSILAYKTGAANVEKYMAALSKLSSILEKLETRRDAQAFQHLLSLFQEPSEAVAQSYRPDQIMAARQHLTQRAEAVAEATIEPAERLSRADLVALNSLIKLKESLCFYQSEGLLQDNSIVDAIIEQGKRAEELADKLIHVLGEPYQTGDLSFRNLGKFDALTGKSQGWMMTLYSHITPFGHAAMIDQTMDLDTIMYSEVLDQYIYRRVPLEEFFATDVYRVNVASLVGEEGKKLLAAQLTRLQELGAISPLMTLDQYIEEEFLAHLDTILAGPAISGPEIEQTEAMVEEQFSPAEIHALVQAKRQSLTKDEGIKVRYNIALRLGGSAFEQLSDEERDLGIIEEYLRTEKTEDELQKLSTQEKHDLFEATMQRRGDDQSFVVRTYSTNYLYRLGVESLSQLAPDQKEIYIIEGIKSLIGLKTAAQLEQERQTQLEEYHSQTFQTIQNDGMLQIRAGINPFHRSMTLPWTTPPQELDFRAIQFQGKMICSQFQALAMLKALALTQESLYEKMAESIAREGSELAPEMEELPPLSQGQQRMYEAALADVRARKLFTMPVSAQERQELLTPKRVVELFQHYLRPVPLAPVAREILDVPEQFFGTALFGTGKPPSPSM